MSGPGWVFVTQASLMDLQCDLVLIPTDRAGSVTRQWGAYARSLPDVVTYRPDGSRRVSPRATVDGHPPARYVDVGAFRAGVVTPAAEASDAVGWLRRQVREALDSAGQDASDYTGRRERPLVGMPVFGTGAGGFDQVRGEVLRLLLEEADRAVSRHRMDVVIVCFGRADLTALQHQRTLGQGLLTAAQHARAVLLGGAAAGGSLAVFLGAGASVASGLPTFPELIIRAAAIHPPQKLSAVPHDATSAAAMAQELETGCGQDGLRERIAQVLVGARHSLLHSLLAGLRVDGVMTTNFDTLFELSARQSYGSVLRKLPGELAMTHVPWLLKLHGDVEGPEPLIVTTDQIRDGTAAFSSVAAASLLIRHVLFVGYSCLDADFLELLGSVRSVLPKGRKLGPVLALEPMAATVQDIEELDVIDLSEPGATKVTLGAARLGEIFCDVLLWQATRDEPGWLLDARYEALGGDVSLRQTLQQLAIPDGAEWATLRRALSELGLPPAGGKPSPQNAQRPPEDR